MGELGLAGELRRVRDLQPRVAEAARLGFSVALVPSARETRGRPAPAPKPRVTDGLRIVEVHDLVGALEALGLLPRLQ